jgi:hypothetical protein
MNLPTRPDEQGAAYQAGAPVTRRPFLGVLLGFGAVVMGAALSVPVIRFALHPLLAPTTKTAASTSSKIPVYRSARLGRLLQVMPVIASM